MTLPMILKTMVAAGAATAAIAAAAPAQAWENPPGQTPVVDSMLVEALEPAARYWQRTTGQTPCNPELFMHDIPGHGAYATFPGSGCTIWVDRSTWSTWSRYLFGPTESDVAGSDNAWAARSVCQLITHERGHNLGLVHTPDGIMDGLPTLYSWTVPECEGWALTKPWRRNHAVAPPPPDVAGSNAPRPVMTVRERPYSVRVARLAPRVRRCQRARYRRAHRASCQRVVRQYRAAKAAG